MAIKMKQARTQKFVCASGLLARRFVTITPGTDSVAYTAAGAKPDGVTVGDEDNLVIEVLLLETMYESFEFDAAGTIAEGNEVQVTGVLGKGTVQTNGAVACLCKGTAVDGSIAIGYNYKPLMGASGTPATGVTAREDGVGDLHKTTLTVSTTLGAIAGGADLGLGKLMYTFPAGEIIVEAAYMSMTLTAADGNIDADTPDVGLGTVVASGAVALLNGTATFENIITGQTATDCSGTATVKTATPTAGSPLVIATAGAHTVYFNVADGWAASGETACPITGTIVLHWRNAV